MPWGLGYFTGWGAEANSHRNSTKGPKRNKTKAKAARRARKRSR